MVPHPNRVRNRVGQRLLSRPMMEQSKPDFALPAARHVRRTRVLPLLGLFAVPLVVMTAWALLKCGRLYGNCKSSPVSEARGWRQQATEHLLIETASVVERLDEVVLFGGAGLRCVRLNNYWCLKQKTTIWPGSIGSDDHGHAAFTKAEASAAAAVSLLRNYFFDRGLNR